MAGLKGEDIMSKKNKQNNCLKRVRHDKTKRKNKRD
jgi:hypothetical protein